MPTTKEEICKLYADSVNSVWNEKGGYTIRIIHEAEEVDFKISIINNIVYEMINSIIEVASEPEGYVCKKGSDDAIYNLQSWKLTEFSAVKSATCKTSGDNYKINIIMNGETAPEEGNSNLM